MVYEAHLKCAALGHEGSNPCSPTNLLKRKKKGVISVVSAVNEPVLVLNRSWQYIAVSVASEVMKDLFTGAVTAIDPDTFATLTFGDWVERGVKPGQPLIKTRNFEIEVPEVIVCVNFNKVPQRSLHYSKYHVFKRDRYTCQYCGAQPGRHALTIDHVRPRSQGGQTDWGNCVTCCGPCNSVKANRTPAQAGMVLAKRPKKPEWSIEQAVRRLAVEQKPFWNEFIKKQGE